MADSQPLPQRPSMNGRPIGRDPRLDFAATLAALEDTIRWLEKEGICVLGFGANKLHPYVCVAAATRIYMVCKDIEERGYRQIGKLRHYTFWARRKDVVICWEEVACVA